VGRAILLAALILVGVFLFLLRREPPPAATDVAEDVARPRSVAQVTVEEPDAAVPDPPLPPGSVTLRGTVEDLGGGPVPGAQVTVSWGQSQISRVADAEGRFEIPCAAGSVAVEITATGYRVRQERVMTPAAPRTFWMWPAGNLRGRVVDEAGATIAGAEVRLGWPARATTSDAQGEFFFADVLGQQRVFASTEDGFGIVAEDIMVEAGEEATVTVVVRRGFPVRARVETRSGKPCATGFTLIMGPDLRVNVPIESGRLAASALPAGSYQVAVECRGHLWRGWETLEVGPEAKEVLWLLDDGVSVRGRVLDGAGLPAPHTQVRARPRGIPRTELVTETDEQGAFRWESLPPELYDFAVQQGGTGWVDVLEAEVGKDTQLELRLPSNGWLEGTVFDASGAPLANTTVVVLRFDSGGRVQALTRADGRFAVALAPNRYIVAALAGGLGPWPSATGQSGVDQEVGVEVPANGSVDVTLRIDRRQIPLTGQVVDPTGLPADEAVVIASREDWHNAEELARGVFSGNWSIEELRAHTDEQGRFDFGPLPWGRYHLSAFIGGHAYARMSVQLSSAPITLVTGERESGYPE
jgi:hypothetical protein